MKERIEIRNFTLWHNGLYCIRYKADDGSDSGMVVSLNPIELTLIFEIEGLDMKNPTRIIDFDIPEYDFEKVILIPKSRQDYQLFDEVVDPFSPIFCEIKAIE